jgi:hypothetical protein
MRFNEGKKIILSSDLIAGFHYARKRSNFVHYLIRQQKLKLEALFE